MRIVRMYENKQRGCKYCTHVSQKKQGYATLTACPFDECPYKVLDKYDTYEEFMASEDSMILVAEFFQTVADCYILSSAVRKTPKMCSDGDFKINL